MELMILVAFAVSAISLTLTRATITIPVREFAADHLPSMLQLLGCPYCMSHWVSIVMALFVNINIVDNVYINYILTVFCLVGMAAIISGVIFKLVLHQEAEIERMRDALIKVKSQLNK